MDVVELERPPSLPALYRKAVAGLLPAFPPGRGREYGDRVPETQLVLRGVAVDRERLAEYARVCGFRLTDTLPATYPYVLAFPLALMLMTAPDFPFPAAGVVHVANRIELHRPLAADEPLDLAVHAEGPRPHERGSQVDLVAVASVGGTQVWRDVSTYLHRSRSGGRGGDGDRPAAPAAPAAPSAAPAAPSAVWRVGAEVGPAYAAVSGDRNPIHTSHLAARAFGFRRRIAHGMWSKARCLAQLATRLPPAYQVEVAFRAPVLLPATVGFSASIGEPGGDFALHDVRSGRQHLSGALSWTGTAG